LSTTYWQLTINQVHGSNTRKMDAFKNCKCADHNLFFGIDLYLVRTSCSDAYPPPFIHYLYISAWGNVTSSVTLAAPMQEE